jgi:hypothetical protein
MGDDERLGRDCADVGGVPPHPALTPAYRGTVRMRSTHIRSPVRRSTRVNLPPFQRLVDAHWRDVARLARALAGPVDGDDVASRPGPRPTPHTRA